MFPFMNIIRLQKVFAFQCHFLLLGAAGTIEELHAMYRETPEMIELRRNEGCITVEMETAAFFKLMEEL